MGEETPWWRRPVSTGTQRSWWRRAHSPGRPLSHQARGSVRGRRVRRETNGCVVKWFGKRDRDSRGAPFLDEEPGPATPSVRPAADDRRLQPARKSSRVTRLSGRSPSASNVGAVEAGGFHLEFPVMSLGETVMRPGAMLLRNLACRQAAVDPLRAVGLLATFAKRSAVCERPLCARRLRTAGRNLKFL